MRKLTTREKTMIGLCGVVFVVVLALFIFRPLLNQWRNTGEEIKLKQTELKSAQELVNFEPSAMAIEDKLRMKTGLAAPIISDEQFNRLKELLTVDDADDGSDKLNINKATRTELVKLGFDKYLVNSILAYRDKIGRFKELEELKNIRGTIFEGQLAEAILSQRLAKIIKDTGVNRIDRLDIKLVPGKKTDTISRDVKKLFVNELYLNELVTEVQNLEGKAPQQKNRQFEPLPDVIPDEMKLNLAKAIIGHKGEIEQKFVELEAATKEQAVQLALRRLRVSEEDVTVEILDKGRQGFLGLFAKPVKIRVTKKEDEQGIIAGFRESLMKYNEELAYNSSGEGDFYDDEYYDSDIEEYGAEDDSSGVEQTTASESDRSSSETIAQVKQSESPSIEESESGSGIEADISNEDVMCSKLAEYFVKVSQKKNALRQWLYSIPISYQKQSYVVEMAFKCEMAQLVNIMYKIESSFRWLSVRDLKISIANKEKTQLSANMSVLATVL
ncbi:MAG: Jag N-terminal domain-containing protein [Candidatus Poribacteria bacterium]